MNVVERGVKPESLAVKGLLASKDSPNPADPTVRAVREPAAVGRKDCRQEHELLDSRNPQIRGHSTYILGLLLPRTVDASVVDVVELSGPIVAACPGPARAK